MFISEPSHEAQAIQAYFSHSYRADDRNVNLFFWRLFSENGFFFSVDPKSGRTFVPHLERMIRQSDCFIAVVTRRLEFIKSIGSVLLPQPQVVWGHSPYIQLENRLAFRSSKPRLIFVESGLDANLFGAPEEVHVFDRDLLDKRERLYGSWVQEFAETVQDYKRYTDRIFQPTRKAGILIDRRGETTYTPEVVDLLADALRAGGYMPTVIEPDMSDDQRFMRDVSDVELLISEVRDPHVTATVQAFTHARFLPTIRICRLEPGESRDNVELPDFLGSYKAGDIDPIVPWRTLDELALEIVQHVQKFQQPRTLLDNFDAGRRYFLSAGRRRAKVFVSNAHTLNDIAMNLIKGFQTVNVEFFHYQATLRIGTAWQDELKRELNECDVFIALINDEYHTSRWCQYELECAFERWRNNRVVILPYLVSQTRLPEMIKDDIQCAFLTNVDQTTAVQMIVDTVDKQLTTIEQTPAVVRDRIGEFEHALSRTAIQSLSLDVVKVVEETMSHMVRTIDMSYDPKSLQLVRDICQVDVDAQQVFGDLPNFPAVLPFFFTRAAVIEQADIDALRTTLTDQNARIAVVVLPADAEQCERTQRQLDTHIRQIYACDVVVLSHDALKVIVRDTAPNQALRRTVLAQINILNYAPFVVNGSTPDQMFFGREAELRTVCEHVQVASYAAIGGRRIGKTSLLTHLYRVRLPSLGFRTIYHDCSTTSTYSAFLNTPVRDWKPDTPVQGQLTFGDLIISQGRSRLVPNDRPLVLLLDEIDKLIPADRDQDWQLFNALRGMANAGRAQVVLGGERVLRDALRDPSGPLFNFANEILIGRLDFHAAQELITRPMRQLEIELDDCPAIVQRIYDFTSGHPNIIQRLCRRLIGRAHQQSMRQVTLADVIQAIDDPDFVRKDFLETYFSRASSLEHLCALLMAANPHARTLSAVQTTLQAHEVEATLNQVDSALERLVDLRNILERTPDGYNFVVTALPLIIAENLRLQDWLSLRREVFRETGDIAPELAPPELQGRLW